MMRIIDMECYIPEKFLDINQVYREYGLSDTEKMVYSRFYGINKIPYSEINMQQMMLKVTKPILDRNTNRNIKYIISPRTTPVVSPIGSSMVRDLGISIGMKDTITMSTNMNKCVSLFKSFEISDAVLNHKDKDSSTLIVIAETVFTSHNRVLPNITITGDAAAAVLVDANAAGNKLVSMSYATYGKYAKGVWMSKEEVSEFGMSFNQCMERVIKQAMQEAHINFDDVKLILPHNVNLPCWHLFAKYVGISNDKIFLDNIAVTSHCFNADLIINLASAIKANRLRPGDYYIMATVAVGAVFGAAVFQYN